MGQSIEMVFAKTGFVEIQEKSDVNFGAMVLFGKFSEVALLNQPVVGQRAFWYDPFADKDKAGCMHGVLFLLPNGEDVFHDILAFLTLRRRAYGRQRDEY